jgi:hypothetical protein
MCCRKTPSGVSTRRGEQARASSPGFSRFPGPQTCKGRVGGWHIVRLSDRRDHKRFDDQIGAATNFALVTRNVNITLNVIGDSVSSPGALGVVGTPLDGSWAPSALHCVRAASRARPASAAAPIDARQKFSSNPQYLFALGRGFWHVAVRPLNLRSDFCDIYWVALLTAGRACDTQLRRFFHSAPATGSGRIPHACRRCDSTNKR